MLAPLPPLPRACAADSIDATTDASARAVERLRRATELAGVGTWELDPLRGTVLFCGRAATIFDVPAETPVAVSEMLTRVDPDDRPVVSEALSCADGQVECRAIVRVTTPNEAVRYVLLRGGRWGGLISGVATLVPEHERALHAHRQAAREWRTLFESIPLPAFLLDPQTLEICGYNAAALETYGYSAETARRLTVRDLLVEVEHDSFLETQRPLRVGLSSAGVWKTRTSDGRIIDVEVTTHDINLGGCWLRIVITNDVTKKITRQRALEDSRAHLERVVDERTEELRLLVEGLRREVAERQRVEKELLTERHKLLTNERLLAASQRIAHVGHWSLDLGSGMCVWSEETFRMLGYQPGECVPSRDRFFARVHPDDRARLEANDDRSRHGGSAWIEEYRVVLPSGETRTILERGEVAFHDGKPVRLLGIVKDVTEPRDLQRCIEERGAFLRAIIDSIPILVSVKDRESRMVVVNRANAEFSSESVEQIERHGRAEGWTTEMERRFREEDERVFASGRPLSVAEERVVDRNGNERYFAKTKTLIHVPGAPGAYLAAIAVETTQSRLEELRRREMEKLAATGRMAARIAHEINNPLAGIKNSFHLLKDAIPSDYPHYHFVGRIEREIDRIAGIVRQMFDLYRPQSESAKRSDVRALFDDVAHLVAAQLRHRGLRLELPTAADPFVLPIQDGVLRPAIFNLVQNAIEASPDGGTIRLSMVETRGGAQISVTDEGAGIPEAIRARIFEPFFTTKSNIATGGLGLGLSIARNAIESLGGTLTYSCSPGRGTTFRIHLPTPWPTEGEPIDASATH